VLASPALASSRSSPGAALRNREGRPAHPATIDVDGRSFKNSDDYPTDRTGQMPFSTAFANSCDTVFLGARHRLETGDLADAAAAPGLGRDHDLGIPASVTHPLDPRESRALEGFMRAVVNEGSGRFLADLPGAVGAKTGTAEYGEPDRKGQLRTHAWMIATQEDLAVAVFVETGRSGSSTAGPLLEEFLR
jgi:cell division protein FtsI/penicillin-binding protein 2